MTQVNLISESKRTELLVLYLTLELLSLDSTDATTDPSIPASTC